MYSRAILLERIQLALLRGIAVAGAVLVSVWIWHQFFSSADFAPWTVYYAPSILLAVLAMVVMWNTPAKYPDSPILGTMGSIGQGIAIVMSFVLALTFFYRADSYSRGTFVVFIPVASVALYVAAVLHLGLLRLVNANTDASRRVVVVGFDAYGRRIAQALLRQPAYFSVIGYLDDSTVLGENGVGHFVNLGTPDDLDSVILANDIDVVMIALSDAEPSFTQELIGVCMARGVDWKAVPPMLDLVLDHVAFEYVDGLPLVGQRRSRLVGYDWYIKRTFDVVITGVLLIVLSPIFLGAYLAVRTTSRGPAIFKQKRIGLWGRPFTLLKFRTMRVDTRSDVHQQATADWILGKRIESATGSEEVHKIRNDQRVTRIGRVLRAVSIDELPQLWNVLRGDMSLVGPRPPIAYEVARYSERHKRRLEVPPGVTGLWQVSGRNSLTFDEMVDLDIDYIERWTLGLDFEILLKTIPAVVSDRGH